MAGGAEGDALGSDGGVTTGTASAGTVGGVAADGTVAGSAAGIGMAEAALSPAARGRCGAATRVRFGVTALGKRRMGFCDSTGVTGGTSERCSMPGMA